MIFSKLFKKKQQPNWAENRQPLKSSMDLCLLPRQVVYVDSEYGTLTNDVVRREYERISRKIPLFVYIPRLDQDVRYSEFQIEVLKYYFPNLHLDRRLHREQLFSFINTEKVTNLLFSFLSYRGSIQPGFLRYLEKDEEGMFVYEYFPIEGAKKSIIKEQVNFYINRLSQIFGEVVCRDEFLQRKDIKDNTSHDIRFPEDKSMSACLFDEECVESNTQYKHELEEECKEAPIIKEATAEKYAEASVFSGEERISQIREDILELKGMGFYELLVRELGEALFENRPEQLHRPSPLVMDEEYKIFLPHFENMEIQMTPLPKALFILFLRHPNGIHLSSLIDYKQELLEIYKLFSYRESWGNMVESINRICNPLEGAVNENLSRIKRAFVSRMSMDTAKHYIVSGERGAEKKIMLEIELIRLPKALEEIERTREK